MRDGGKGDAPRPLVIPMEKFDENFERIFGRKPPKPSYEFEPIPFAGIVDIGEDDEQ
jgi:hypothetical protein